MILEMLSDPKEAIANLIEAAKGKGKKGGARWVTLKGGRRVFLTSKGKSMMRSSKGKTPGKAPTITTKATNRADIKAIGKGLPETWRGNTRLDSQVFKDFTEPGNPVPKVIKSFVKGGDLETATFMGVLKGGWKISGGGEGMFHKETPGGRKGYTVYHATQGGFGSVRSRQVKTLKEAATLVTKFAPR